MAVPLVGGGVALGGASILGGSSSSPPADLASVEGVLLAHDAVDGGLVTC